MESISDDARRYLLHQRLARRWIRDGGVVIANAETLTGARSTFDFSETISSGASLQVTFNLREVSKACKFLNDYAVYLWNCEHDGEYVLCALAEGSGLPFAMSPVAASARGHRRVPAACYAGSFPSLNLDIYDAQYATPPASQCTLMTRMLLPRGLCAAVYQSSPREMTTTKPDLAGRRAMTRSMTGGMVGLRSFPRTPQTIAQDA